MADREALTKRVLPSMQLAQGSDNPLPVLPPTNRAAARFQVEGNIIITGGAGTLGLSAARALLEHGASGISLWDLESTLHSNQKSILELSLDFPGTRIFGIGVDVTDATACAEALTSTIQTFGGEPVRHLFCFAGIVSVAHALEVTDVEWRRVLDVNSTGSFLVAQAVAREMVARGTRGGSITLTASISGHRVNFPQPQVAYNVSKAAVVALKASLAAEWARYGIRVNSISPGYMDTILNDGDGVAAARVVWAERTPMGRMGAVGELDGVCVLLASRAGSYITGSDFVIDGGITVF